MGYFSELSLLLQERKEALLNDESWNDHSYPSIKQQLIWRLGDFKEKLRQLVDERRKWEIVYYGEPKSDYERQYSEWENYWPLRNPAAFYMNPDRLEPEVMIDIDAVMEAIACAQYRLLSYGYDADAEEALLAEREKNKPLDGQLSLPLAA